MAWSSGSPFKRGSALAAGLAAGLLTLTVEAETATQAPSKKPRHEIGTSPRLDRNLPAASPFRLNISRSEYALAGSAAPQENKRESAGRTRNVKLAKQIDRHAQAKGLDPALVHAVIRAESAYKVDAVSPKGAIGLMQVMPETGRRFGVDELANPEKNLQAGTAYLRRLVDLYGNIPLALAAYNAGEGAVARYGNTIPPYPETQAYVNGILRNYWGATVPGAPLKFSYLEGTRLEESVLASYRLRVSGN